MADRVGGSTHHPRVEVSNPPAGTHRRPIEPPTPEITEADARHLIEAPSLVLPAGARSSGKLTEGQALAMNVLLRAAGMMFSHIGTPGDKDPNSGDS